MNLTCIFFGLIFITAGIFFAIGKLHCRMDLWKNMPEEEKEKISIARLCRNIGGMIVLSGIIFLLKGITPQLFGGVFIWAMIGWLVFAGLDVWYISKSNRYRNTQKGGNAND